MTRPSETMRRGDVGPNIPERVPVMPLRSTLVFPTGVIAVQIGLPPTLEVLAAYRAGLRNVILPTGNERDLRDVPNEIREKLHFDFVERMDEVMQLALLGPMAAEAESRRREKRARAGRERRAAAPRPAKA